MALVAYIVAGDPSPERTVPLMETLVASGVDIIELGVPFSDPMADGPAIQRACERALSHKTSYAETVGFVADFRTSNARTPVVLMGYLNPLEAMGYESAVGLAKKAEADGFLIVDMPPEEGVSLVEEMLRNHLDPIFLLAPTTPETRIRTICKSARGFIYYVSLRGVTGAGNLSCPEIVQRLAEIKRHTHLPVGVGFGIKNAAVAAEISVHCDAIVVGSAIVQCIERHPDDWPRCQAEISTLLRSMRQAMDAATGGVT